MKHKLIFVILTFLLIGGFLVRLKDIQSPLADWHSFRQADTASVAREYVKHGINLLVPTYHDLSNIQSGKENPAGYRMVEFPLISGFVAFIYKTFTFLQIYELHVVYRFVNVIFSLISAFLIFAIVRREESEGTGLLAAFFFLFLPFNVFYSRTILPEIAMITASLLALYAGIRFVKKQTFLDGTILALASATALLLKPTAIFLLLPLLPYAIAKKGWKVLISPVYILIAIISILPLIGWRQWIQAYPTGIPTADWLLNSNGIRFKGAFFHWLFADRLGRLILGYWGLILLGVGLITPKKTNLFMWWVIGTLLYVTVFATGNVQHDYYQIPTIPIIAILMAYGVQFLRHLPLHQAKKHTLITITILATFAFSWYHIRAYYGINNPAIVLAGRAVDELTPKDALIIAPYMGDTAFMYQTNRKGWPIGFNIEDRIKAGATYYVSTSLDDETRELSKTYTVINQTPEYTLIHLVPNASISAQPKALAK